MQILFSAIPIDLEKAVSLLFGHRTEFRAVEAEGLLVPALHNAISAVAVVLRCVLDELLVSHNHYVYLSFFCTPIIAHFYRFVKGFSKIFFVGA